MSSDTLAKETHENRVTGWPGASKNAVTRMRPDRRHDLMTQHADIICFCGQDWWYHNRAHSDFQLMTRAAAKRKVLLINTIGMRMPMPGRSPMPFRRMWRKLKSMLRGVSRPLEDRPDYVVMTPVLFPFYGSPAARAFNAWLVRWQVARQARKMGIRHPHVIITVPTAWEVARKMEYGSLVYNRSDKHSAFSEADGPLITRLEYELFANTDRVFYSSRSLSQSEREHTGSRSRFLDHGVDTKHFAPRPRPEKLAALGCKRPIVGFFGGLDDYVVDFGLLERIASERPHYSLVLIGDATLPLDFLTRHPNVHHLGFRPYQEIPELGADFDVSIMPWLHNEWTLNCNPIKLKEYLSLGQEVVTTFFPEVEHYLDHVHLARTGDEFLTLIDEVIAGKRSPGDRKALLHNATWDDRTDELLAALDEITVEKAGKGTEAECAAS